jgi:hypothetical protein
MAGHIKDAPELIHSTPNKGWTRMQIKLLRRIDKQGSQKQFAGNDLKLPPSDSKIFSDVLHLNEDLRKRIRG